jgi:regulator of sigma E protease
MTVVVPVVVLGLLIFFHELGHFVVAKRAGIAVLELSFGMGPRLLSTIRGETRYSLRALPFGGSVSMATDLAEADDAPPVAPGRTFESKPVRTRVAVIAAGPVMNFLLTVLLLTLVFGVIGIEQPQLGSTVLGSVVAGGPADAAGLQPGDRVLAVDGRQVTDWPAMVQVVQGALGRPITVAFLRDGATQEVVVTPAPHPQNPNAGYLGIASSVLRLQLPMPLALRYALSETGRMLTLWVGAVAGIFRGQGAPDVSGPIGIIQMLGEASRFGLANLFFLAAVISANFGLINLFPIPALDGSRLVFLAVEAIRGKAVSPEHEGRLHLVGYGLLMALLVILTYRDIVRLGGGTP